MSQDDASSREELAAAPPQSKEMSRGAKALLGILTFWPPAYFVLFIVFVIASIAFESARQGPNGLFFVILPLHIFTILETVGLTLYYAVKVYRDPVLKDDRKLMWMVIVLLGSFIGQAIFYVLWIVKRSPIVSGPPSGSASPAGPSATHPGE